jgi:hypothetical protein
MRVEHRAIEGLDRYLMSRQVLAGVQTQLDHEGLVSHVVNSDEAFPDGVEGVVAMLCQEVKAAAKLTSAAESLCAALVADPRYRPGTDALRGDPDFSDR